MEKKIVKGSKHTLHAKAKRREEFPKPNLGVAHMVGLTMLARWKGSDGCAIWSWSWSRSWGRGRGRTGYWVVSIGIVARGFVNALTSAQRTRVSPSG